MKRTIIAVLRYIRDTIFDFITKVRIITRNPHTSISRNSRFSGTRVFEKIKIGEGSIIGDFTFIVIENDQNNPNGVASKLEIGQNTYLGELNNIRAAGGVIKIGNNCCISQHVTIVASNHSYKKGINITSQPWNTTKHSVTIGNDVWIGANVVVLPGVTIHDGAVIGAGTIVNKDIPENAVAVGNPMKLIKDRN